MKTELQIGDPAPGFPALKKHRGSTVVLYFYPKDFTSGCTVEACEFRDAHAGFTRAKTVVIGVSPDTAESHERFAVARESDRFQIRIDGTFRRRRHFL